VCGSASAARAGRATTRRVRACGHARSNAGLLEAHKSPPPAARGCCSAASLTADSLSLLHLWIACLALCFWAIVLCILSPACGLPLLSSPRGICSSCRFCAALRRSCPVARRQLRPSRAAAGQHPRAQPARVPQCPTPPPMGHGSVLRVLAARGHLTLSGSMPNRARRLASRLAQLGCAARNVTRNPSHTPRDTCIISARKTV
jgi:hypothetical protein